MKKEELCNACNLSRLMFVEIVSNQLSLRATTKFKKHMAGVVKWQSSLKLLQIYWEDCHTSLRTGVAMTRCEPKSEEIIGLMLFNLNLHKFFA
jgi:RAB protein geranylgeranyltransferase component A